MKLQISFLFFVFAFFLFSVPVLAQNVGIGTTTPQAKLHVAGSQRIDSNLYVAGNTGIGINGSPFTFDVNGTTLLRGTNSNSISGTAKAGVEFFVGRTLNGTAAAGNTLPDIAFNFGGAGGGYRHFITTRHNNQMNSAGNAIDFYLNNFTVPFGSSQPGTNNKLMLSVTAVGVGVNTNNPLAMLDVAGDIKASGMATINESVYIQDSVVIGRIAPQNTPNAGAGLYVYGNTKIEAKNTVEFGSGIAGKETNAGKIGYQAFSADALDIVGAGTTGSNRKINFFNEGGATFNGPVKIGAVGTAINSIRLYQSVINMQVYPSNIVTYAIYCPGLPAGATVSVTFGADFSHFLHHVHTSVVSADYVRIKILNNDQIWGHDMVNIPVSIVAFW